MAQKSGKKNRKLGRDIKKCGTYRTLHIREKNKLKRIVHSNGVEAARAYGQKHAMTDYARKVINAYERSHAPNLEPTRQPSAERRV